MVIFCCFYPHCGAPFSSSFLNYRSHGRSNSVMLTRFAFIVVSAGKVCVPRQMVINNDPSSIPHEVTSAGLKLPLGRVSFLFAN